MNFGLGAHAGFIVASYLITLAVVVGLIIWVRMDRARQEAALAELEAQGIVRRSSGTQSGAQASASQQKADQA